jgi:phosphatidylglycerol:prolipoprotein diacylglycerol transferase
MDRVALDLGMVQIYWYSIFIFLGVLAASIVVEREAKRRGIEDEFIVNLIFNCLIFGIIGARLYYVAFNLNYYLKNPIEILEIWNGGLAIHGGLLAGILTLIIYSHKHKVNALRMLDIACTGAIIGQAIGRWGNFFNSEAYGAVTTLATLKSQGIPTFIINGMYINGAYHQPTFFYESAWCLFGFLAILIIRKYKYLKVGKITGFYLIWYGIERFIVEGMRTDSLMLGNFKIAQIVSIIFIIVGLIIFFYHKKNTSQLDDLYAAPKNVAVQSTIQYQKNQYKNYRNW